MGPSHLKTRLGHPGLISSFQTLKTTLSSSAGSTSLKLTPLPSVAHSRISRTPLANPNPNQAFLSISVALPADATLNNPHRQNPDRFLSPLFFQTTTPSILDTHHHLTQHQLPALIAILVAKNRYLHNSHHILQTSITNLVVAQHHLLFSQLFLRASKTSTTTSSARSICSSLTLQMQTTAPTTRAIPIIPRTARVILDLHRIWLLRQMSPPRGNSNQLLLPSTSISQLLPSPTLFTPTHTLLHQTFRRTLTSMLQHPTAATTLLMFLLLPMLPLTPMNLLVRTPRALTHIKMPLHSMPRLIHINLPLRSLHQPNLTNNMSLHPPPSPHTNLSRTSTTGSPHSTRLPSLPEDPTQVPIPSPTTFHLSHIVDGYTAVKDQMTLSKPLCLDPSIAFPCPITSRISIN